MKNKLLCLLMVIPFLSVACSGTPSSSSSSFSSQSSGESSSSSSESSIPTSKEILDKYYEVEEKELVNVFFPGDKMLYSSASESTNYLILDISGRIVYTAGYIFYGYGTRMKSYHSVKYDSLMSSMFSSGKVTVPESMLGYELGTESYVSLIRKISNNQISLADAEDPASDAIVEWNSTKNKYINDKIGIKIKESAKMETRNEVAFRLSSIFDNLDSSGSSAYLMEVPYDDSYSISSEDATVKVYRPNGSLIQSVNNLYTFSKGEEVVVKATGQSFANFTIDVRAVKNEVELPYEVSENPSLDSYDTQGDSSVNPYVNPTLKVTKRNDGKGLYVNCNNPEALYDDCLNTVLTGQEVTDKEVFFTYEHNNKIETNYYYAYRVTNTGDKDIFVTVKNIGNQIDGDGCWLGENEWTQFYNLNFRVKGIDKFTTSQKKNFDAYVGFCNSYEAAKNQPITYRVPKGKYIYVLGGTTLDAYKNINVFNTADVPVSSKISGCSNGAVLFEVSGGKAYGQFMAYNSNDASSINNTDYITKHKQYGYSVYVETGSGQKFVGSQYSGYDNCHGVVDTNLEFTFNDKTKGGTLPVNYKNPYYSTSTKGTAYGKVTNVSTKTHTGATLWVTHINPASTINAIGTDMTKYITTDHTTGNPIVIQPENYDGNGDKANIGNWMVDYIDTFTLVNQGSVKRTFTYTMNHNGVILAFVRDENGMVDTKAYPVSYQTVIASSTYGAAISEPFSYSIEVPAHSVVRFSVDYNLCANSNGYITHTCKLV